MHLTLYKTVQLSVAYPERSSEIAHRIAVRVALFVGKDLFERVEIFNQIKKGYDVQSKVIHGSFFKEKDIEEVSGLSIILDNLLRRIHHPDKLKTLDFSNLVECRKYFLNIILERK